MKPVVFFSISNGWGIRNFVHTGLISEIGNYFDVGVACPENFNSYFESIRKKGDIKFVLNLPKADSGIWMYSRKLKKLLLQANHDIATARIKSSSGTKSRILKAAKSIGWSFVGFFASYWQIKLIEEIELIFVGSSEASVLVKPSVFVNCSPFDSRDIKLQRYMQRCGIPTIAIIPSWDNPSTKGCILTGANRVFVWGAHQKSEILTYYPSFKPESVKITGIPQFDAYINDARGKMSRDAFLGKYGIQKDTKILLYATCSERLFPQEPDIVKALVSAVHRGDFGRKVHIIIRCHPADRSARYEHLTKFNFVTLQPPTRQECETLQSWVPPELELSLLSATLNACDICINTASTMTLDALACGKPVINVGYEPEICGFENSVLRYYSYHHYAPIANSGAVPLAKNEDELIGLVGEFLKNGDFLKKKRDELVQKFCFQPENGSVSEIVREISVVANIKTDIEPITCAITD